MSYRSIKRRNQRRQYVARVQYWKDVRKANKDAAFKLWMEQHKDSLNSFRLSLRAIEDTSK